LAARRTNDNDSDDENSALQSVINLRKCEANDFIVVVVPNVRVMRGTQQFVTTKVLLKFPVVLAKDYSKYKLELHQDGKGVNLHYPRLPSLDLEGVTDMCTRDFQAVQPGGSAAQFEQMQNRYHALFTTVRGTQGKNLIKIASYRFKEGEECSAEFFNVDSSNRTLDPKLVETKQLVLETVDPNNNNAPVKKYQVLWFMVWQLTLVEATLALSEAPTTADTNLLVGAFARATLHNNSVDDAMAG
jgi:hypothetical protein